MFPSGTLLCSKSGNMFGPFALEVAGEREGLRS